MIRELRFALAAGSIAFSLAAAWAFPARAQERYPERPIRLLIPFAPGASTDIIARKLGARLTPMLGQSIVIENRTGAAGTIATNEVARAKPDGHTLILGTVSTHILNPLTMKNIPYDPLRDLSHVILLGTSTTSVTVHPTVAATLPELIKRVRALPGRYSYGSTGQGGIIHLAGELFKMKAGGLDIVHVPYKGSGAGLNDIIGGQIPIMLMALGTAMPHHRAGKVRALAAFSERRSQVAPDIPTFADYGISGVVAYSCVLLSGPAATPKRVVDQLYLVIQKLVMDETFQKDLLSAGFDPVLDSNPQRANQFVKDELAKWGPIVKETGVTAD
jgi:tripartite-type tricarboxylate transporter receptor subunit TctC